MLLSYACSSNTEAACPSLITPIKDPPSDGEALGRREVIDYRSSLRKDRQLSIEINPLSVRPLLDQPLFWCSEPFGESSMASTLRGGFLKAPP